VSLDFCHAIDITSAARSPHRTCEQHVPRTLILVARTLADQAICAAVSDSPEPTKKAALYPRDDVQRWVLAQARQRPERRGRARLDATFARLRADRTRSAEYLFVSRLGYSHSIHADVAWMRSVHGRGPYGRITNVIEWLAEDPFCYNSGYLKQTVMRLLRSFDFTEAQADELRSVVLDVLPRGRRKEFRELRRLARRVDSPGFRDDLRALITASDADTAERARMVLGLCERPRRS
jgi:hypothetical protein